MSTTQKALCPPCQVIRWDEVAAGMLRTADRFVTMKLEGVKIPIPVGWEERWYEAIEESCGRMEALLAEITGGSSSS